METKKSFGFIVVAMVKTSWSWIQLKGQNMKTKIYMLIAIATCIGLLLLTGFPAVAGLLDTSVTLTFSGVVRPMSTPTPTPTPNPTPTPTGPYSYIINVLGSNYQMTDGITGQVIYQGTNATQVVNNAIGNLTQGNSILFNSGTYNLNGSITGTNKDNITLAFENGAELFVANNMNAPAIVLTACNNWLIQSPTINGNAANQVIGNIDFPNNCDGITLWSCSNVHVDGAYIYNCRRFGFSTGNMRVGISSRNGITNSLLLNNSFNGIQLSSPGDLSCYAINNEVAYSSDVGITNFGGTNNIVQNNYVHDMNGTTGYVNSQWGIGIEDGSSHIITGNTIQNCLKGIMNNGFNNCTISNNVVTNSGTYAPAGGAVGIMLSNGQGPGSEYNSVTDNIVTGIYCNAPAWNGGIGIFLQDATFNLISGNVVSQCGSNGIILGVTSNNNTVSLNVVSDTAAGYSFWAYQYAGCGIQIAGGSNYINQNQVFDDRSGPAKTQQYGIAMESGAYNNILIGNNVHNNLNRQITDTNVPENTMINNTGYNPVGAIASPISGSTAYLVDSGSSSTWISGRVYTNTGSPKVLNISAGTVSVVAQNGETLFTATNCTVTLQPEDTFSVTFNTTPTINVTGQ